MPVVVTLNAFATDTQAELDYVEQFCKERGCEFAISEVWEKGGEGGIALAEKVLDALENRESNFKVLYDDELSLKEKIETIAKEIYGADGVTYSNAANKELKRIEDLGNLLSIDQICHSFLLPPNHFYYICFVNYALFRIIL